MGGETHDVIGVSNHLAVCVDATGGADLVTGEPPTASEGVSGGASGAATDGHVVLDSAV